MLTLATVMAAGTWGTVHAQVGQPGFQPAAGLVNQAVGPLGVFRGDLPGYFYYGVNPADRGLGYNGSYMTLGGYIPYADDELGGLWAADIRSHLSVNGGFFSNVGAVRKQLIGGTLLGFGVYWDYDGDLNQYPLEGVPGADFGQFGHVYHQVGVSGEWLTDFGNLRSNGYIPVGTTAYTLGAPGSPFHQNLLLCQTGLDAALGGADLEVGAYIPGLTDWSGMISVGGYALGNTGYTWATGPTAGEAVVPWFGGVYTRLDMTFVENWDFSLQANNDSYFDWTGFARLTYRMGGSRRRNVPDQMEQPIMRNEHVVRAHQTPIVALNPDTGLAWNVIHVDNSAAPGGDGTTEAPVRTLALAQPLATNPYDIVYVHAGNSATSPYAANWQFQADNQILVGQGSSLELNTLTCGFRQFFNGSGVRPVLASTGTAIDLRNGAIVDHFRIQGLGAGTFGITNGASLTAGGTANVNDVQIAGTGATGGTGIALTAVPAGANVNLYNMDVQDLTQGIVIDGGAADVTFQGLVNIDGSSNESIRVANTTGGVVNINTTTDTLSTSVARSDAILVTYALQDANSQATNAAVVIDSTTATTINLGPVSVENPTVAGILLDSNTNSTITVTQATVADSVVDGVQVFANAGSTIDLNRVSVTNPGQAGVLVGGNTNTAITFTDLLVSDAGGTAFTTAFNDAATVLTITGSSNLSSTSTISAAFASLDAAQFAITLSSLESAVQSGTNNAVNLQGTSGGFFTISDSFLVANPAPPPPTVQGTVAADVNNTTTGPVVVTVPP
jgi:hypothetical protein